MVQRAAVLFQGRPAISAYAGIWTISQIQLETNASAEIKTANSKAPRNPAAFIGSPLFHHSRGREKSFLLHPFEITASLLRRHGAADFEEMF